jgi:16S rRNA processing protein RimM
VTGVDPDDNLIAVGRIGPVYGVHGATYVEPWTDAPAERFAPGAVLLTDPQSVGPLTVESSQWHGNRFVAHFRGVNDPLAAKALRATQLLIRAGSRPPLDDPDEFYDSDLAGLRAVGADGHEYGIVEQMVHLGAADYLVVRIGTVERLVPFVSAIVGEVDVTGGRVVIDPPDGLFDL